MPACSLQEGRELQMLRPSAVWDPRTSCHMSYTAPVPQPILPPALLAPTSPKGASNFPCLINPSLLPKGALSTPLANPD